MEQAVQDKWESFQELLSKISSYSEAIGLLHWDLQTGAPRKGIEVPLRNDRDAHRRAFPAGDV